MSTPDPSDAAPGPIGAVVGIGTSGPDDAIGRLLSCLPLQAGVCYVVVGSTDPAFLDALASTAALPVRAARMGEPLQPELVSVVSPDQPLIVSGRYFVAPRPSEDDARASVDLVFCSLAREFGDKVLGALLSGRGHDGVEGLRAIREARGLAMVQTPTDDASATHHAVELGVADLTVEPSRLPEVVRMFLAGDRSHARLAGGERAVAAPDEEWLTRIVTLVDSRPDFDAHSLSFSTVERRVRRRMLLTHIDDADAYVARLEEDPSERRALADDLLTGVTEFFRDPQAFDVLRTEVIHPMVRDAAPDQAIRCWVPACSTGQEAYSIGMEWLEAFRAHDKPLKLRIFATDVDAAALETARRGWYDASATTGIPPDRLETYFTPEGKGFRVRPLLRDTIALTTHDVTRAPPFSRMSLVSCRNMLIYLRDQAQARVLESLCFALGPDGVLFLGSSESPGAQSPRLETISPRWRIYRRLPGGAPIHTSVDPSMVLARLPLRPRRPRRPPREVTDGLRQALIEAALPPTVVVSETGVIRYAHGDLRPYLQYAMDRKPTFDLRTLLTPAVASRTRIAWQRCRREQATVVASAPHEDGRGCTRITARSLSAEEPGVVALSFEEIDESPPRTSASPDVPPTLVAQLEAELEQTRAELQETVDELEVHNQQLWDYSQQAARMNEALQTTNEELASATEELRSINEELTAVNAQLRLKVEQLGRARDDISNFLSSTRIPTIILDEALVLQHMTPAATEALGVESSHRRWFVGDLALPALGDDLVAEAHDVLEGGPSRFRLVSIDGRYFERRLHPYRTEEQVVAGLVVTWTDVTEVHQAAEALRESEERLRLAAEAAKIGTFDLDLRTGVETWTPTLKVMFGLPSDADTPQDAIGDGLIHPEDAPLLQEKAKTSFDPNASDSFVSEHRILRSDGQVRWLFVKFRTFFKGKGASRQPIRTLGMALDITKRKHTEQRLAESEAKIRRLFDQAPALIAIHEGPDHRYVYSNPPHDRAVGNRRLVERTLREAMPELEGQGIFERFDRVYRTRKAVNAPPFSATFDRYGDGVMRTGRYRQVLQPWFHADGEIAGVMSFAFEVEAVVEPEPPAGT